MNETIDNISSPPSGPSLEEPTPVDPISAIPPIHSSHTALEADIKVFAALSYFSILFVVPWVVKKDNSFVAFHIKRGMVLFAAELIAWFILWLIESFLIALFSMPAAIVVVWLYKLIWLLFAVVSVAGVYWAITGKEKSLPWVEVFAKNIKL
ncbi:MAG: hypothetical protein WC805_02260 [Patescibacteria group bacterium]|jgi:hypothetical protein